jgi:protein-tyrosine-phosphatase
MNSEQIRTLERRARVHAALGDVTRLRVVELLLDGDLSFAELGTALDVSSNLLAHHLGVLEDAGLLRRHRSEGDRRRTYLSLDPGALPGPLHQTAGLVPAATGRVLFVCTANTARSHLAAALWRAVSPVAATSAGTHPGERIHRGALATARRHHLDLPDVPPQALADTLVDGDLVITVCDRAHEEIDDLAWAHWSIPDPVPSGSRAAFDDAHDALAVRVHELATRVTSTASP